MTRMLRDLLYTTLMSFTLHWGQRNALHVGLGSWFFRQAGCPKLFVYSCF